MPVNQLGLPPVADWHAVERDGSAAAVRKPHEPVSDPRSTHRALPAYEQTPLLDAPSIAAHLGLRQVWVKDETVRLSLPSFKVLGASYAIQRALRARLGDAGEWESFAQWRAGAAALGSPALVTATDGNHGRAVAYVARLLGLPARVLVPTGMSAAHREAIRGEGAVVEVVDGTYDDAIAALHPLDDERNIVISDTSWDGYEEVPRWVVAGYATIFMEIASQLEEIGADQPDVVLIQAGVGSLASAAVTHWTAASPRPPLLLSVEPAGAACVLAALRSGEPTLVPGPHRSIMAGLNCGLVSAIALPLLIDGLDGAVTISDVHARAGVRLLHEAGIACGETGAAGVAGLLALRASEPAWSGLGLDGVESALTICTEGVTDPEAIAAILAMAPEES